MADFLASIFGGGAQQAPVLPTFDPNKAISNFLGQNFGQEQTVSDNFTKNTSATNLNTNLAGLNQVNSGALTGLNEEQSLGNSLLSGSGSGLPAWAQTYLNNAKMQGAESTIGRGVGAFSNNGLSGVNEYIGNNAFNLIGLGSNLTNNAFDRSQNLVNANMYRNNPQEEVVQPGQFLQAGEFNTGILGQNATNAAAAENWNNNNSPEGAAIRTGMQTLTYLAGSFLGSAGKGMAVA